MSSSFVRNFDERRGRRSTGLVFRRKREQTRVESANAAIKEFLQRQTL